MRTYYLFIIKNDYYRIYRRNMFVLYKTLENLYHLKNYDFPYGLSMYRQLCQPFAINLLNNYIKGKYPYKKVNRKIIQIDSLIETTFLQITHACIIVKSDKNFPNILKTFHVYNKHIFICDFNNQDFFWLSEQILKLSKHLS